MHWGLPWGKLIFHSLKDRTHICSLHLLRTTTATAYNAGNKSYGLLTILGGFPSGAKGKTPTCQCRRCKDGGSITGSGKIPWRRKWQLSPTFFPGESRGQRSLEGYSPWGGKELDMTEHMHTHTHTHTCAHTRTHPSLCKNLQSGEASPVHGTLLRASWGQPRTDGSSPASILFPILVF